MRKVLMGIANLWAGPALAVEHAFIGKRAETADKTCKEPLLLTDTTMEVIGDDTWQCRFPAAGQGGRSWTLHMNRATEGKNG